MLFHYKMDLLYFVTFILSPRAARGPKNFCKSILTYAMTKRIYYDDYLEVFILGSLMRGYSSSHHAQDDNIVYSL